MFMLVNKEDEKVVLTEVNIADSIGKRFIGLMGKASLQEEKGLLLRPCNSIHTFFMKFPIDVAFIDKNNQVLMIISDMQPSRISPIVRKSAYVIESSSNVLSKKLKVGDEIELLEAEERM